MKSKNLKSRKLTLDINTIRKLDQSDLAAVVGGLALSQRPINGCER